jgi:hypothetical protein
MPMKPELRLGILLLCGSVLALCACDEPDWRPKAIAAAEDQMRSRLGDPAARFARVQLTGDRSSGQTCGFVTAQPAASAGGGTGRFIVYIDNPTRPFIEYSVGIATISEAQFEFQWEHDCVDGIQAVGGR